MRGSGAASGWNVFIVSNLPAAEYEPQELYEKKYCARADGKPHQGTAAVPVCRQNQLGDHAGQSASVMVFLAYVIMSELPGVVLRGTKLARATCQSIRLKLLKIGAQVRVSVRRVEVSLSSGYPYRELFIQILANLRREYRLQR